MIASYLNSNECDLLSKSTERQFPLADRRAEINKKTLGTEVVPMPSENAAHKAGFRDWLDTGRNKRDDSIG